MNKKLSVYIAISILLIISLVNSISGNIETNNILEFQDNNQISELRSIPDNISIDLQVRKINEDWQDNNITGYVGTILEFRITIDLNRNYPLLTAAISLPEEGNEPIFDYIENSEYSSKRTTFFEADDTTVFFSWLAVLGSRTITCTFQAQISRKGIDKIVNSLAAGIKDIDEQTFDNATDNLIVTAKPSPYPETPDKPYGINEGFVNEIYVFTTSTTDPYDKNLYYKFNWGDGISDWIGPISSGSIIVGEHNWTKAGSYSIRVKAKNEDNYESDWSESHVVTISKKVEITKPSYGLYLGNSKIFNFPLSLIIGKIDIVVSTPGITEVDYVEFYINNQYQDTIYNETFSWTWQNIFFGRASIKVIVFDTQGSKNEDEIIVWKFF